MPTAAGSYSTSMKKSAKASWTSRHPAGDVTLGAEKAASALVPLLRPIASANAATTATPLQGAKHDQVIVYIVGGVTYEEATKVAELNAANAGVSVVLGGSFVHNSGTFLEDLDDAFGGRR